MKIIIDTDSLIHFFQFYYFDKKISNVVYKKLYGFLISKIHREEIIIIDKVYNELQHSFEKGFKEEIKKKVKKTTTLIKKVQELRRDHYINSNEHYYNNNSTQIEIEIRKYEDKFADLYLISTGIFYRDQGEDVFVVSDENKKESGNIKLIRKIPSICVREKIECIKIPDLLFDVYNNELRFQLNEAK